ncbi:hypothetical protein PLICRDRAFT_52022 [Plicaturopsis crispa FD-325 SS-3]|nr:hypothetical protein PLICRDRAFT_52022 [Plicaturopsis crispa FD-325 SS-3]
MWRKMRRLEWMLRRRMAGCTGEYTAGHGCVRVRRTGSCLSRYQPATFFPSILSMQLLPPYDGPTYDFWTLPRHSLYSLVRLCDVATMLRRIAPTASDGCDSVCRIRRDAASGNYDHYAVTFPYCRQHRSVVLLSLSLAHVPRR